MKNKQKGFIIPLLIIIAALAIGGGVYFYYQKYNDHSSVSTIDDWKIYENKAFNYSIKYPPDFSATSTNNYSVYFVDASGMPQLEVKANKGEENLCNGSTESKKIGNNTFNITDLSEYYGAINGSKEMAYCLTNSPVSYSIVFGLSNANRSIIQKMLASFNDQLDPKFSQNLDSALTINWAFVGPADQDPKTLREIYLGINNKSYIIGQSAQGCSSAGTVRDLNIDSGILSATVCSIDSNGIEFALYRDGSNLVVKKFNVVSDENKNWKPTSESKTIFTIKDFQITTSETTKNNDNLKLTTMKNNGQSIFDIQYDPSQGLYWSNNILYKKKPSTDTSFTPDTGVVSFKVLDWNVSTRNSFITDYVVDGAQYITDVKNIKRGENNFIEMRLKEAGVYPRLMNITIRGNNLIEVFPSDQPYKDLSDHVLETVKFSNSENTAEEQKLYSMLLDVKGKIVDYCGLGGTIHGTPFLDQCLNYYHYK